MRPTKNKIFEKNEGASIRVELRDLSKAFGDVVANDGVSFHVESGEILGLVGENGAGKSTCMSMLFGHIEPDRGTILLNNEEVRFRSPKEAILAGIGMVHQHFMLAPALTAIEHLRLVASYKAGPVAHQDVRSRALQSMKSLGFDLELDEPVERLSVGKQQQLEILKVICQGARVIILDEPTAVLTPVEVAPFLERLRRLRDSGHAVILISHKLDEVLQVCGRIVVMRSGRIAGEFDGKLNGNEKTSQMSIETLANAMIGESGESLVRDAGVTPGESRQLNHFSGGIPALEIHDYNRPAERAGPMPAATTALALALNMSVHQGEIVGIAGVEGNGQADLFKAILRTVPRLRGESGSICVAGHEVVHLAPGEVRKAARIAVLPFDRRSEGLMLDADPASNLLLSGVTMKNYFMVPWNQLRQRAANLFLKYGIQPAGWTGAVGSLSGGNQQKFLVARELEQDPALILAAHPTRGVDWRSSQKIHQALVAARARGVGVLLVSSDLDELCALSDRILVMLRGRVVREFSKYPESGFDVAAIGLAMAGGGAS